MLIVLVNIFWSNGMIVLFIIVRYNKFEFWLVLLFMFWIVRLKIVGNIMELYNFIVKIVSMVNLLLFSIVSEISIIVFIVCIFNILVGEKCVIIVVLMNCFIMVLF